MFRNIKYLVWILVLYGNLALQPADAQFRSATFCPVFMSPFAFHEVNTGNPGLQIGAVAEIGLPVRLHPTLTWLIPHRASFFSGHRTTSYWELGTDALYLFSTSDRFEWYGLGGIRIALLGSRYKGPDPDFNPAYHENTLGFSLGAGGTILINDQWNAIAKAGYIFRPFKSGGVQDQFFVSAGISYLLK